MSVVHDALHPAGPKWALHTAAADGDALGLALGLSLGLHDGLLVGLSLGLGEGWFSQQSRYTGVPVAVFGQQSPPAVNPSARQLACAAQFAAVVGLPLGL